MVYFETVSGSVYEVDEDKKLIRRMQGTEAPTVRQGKDGEWRRYLDLLIDMGKSAIILWDPKDTSLLEGSLGGQPSTVTSKVITIY
jgi:hypothetical protein